MIKININANIEIYLAIMTKPSKELVAAVLVVFGFNFMWNYIPTA